jgi:hypothetical protein
MEESDDVAMLKGLSVLDASVLHESAECNINSRRKSRGGGGGGGGRQGSKEGVTNLRWVMRDLWYSLHNTQ